MVSTLILGLLLSQSPSDPIALLELEMESREWTPPKTSLPESFVDAARGLFASGLADPSGGELRHVTVLQWSSSTGSKYETELLGWVLPETSQDRSLVVAITGLIYEPLVVGAQVSLEEFLSKEIRPTGYEYIGARFNSSALSGLIPVALFLRVGDVKTAEALFKFRIGGADVNKVAFASNLVTEYAMSRYHRAVGAHMNGVDEVVLRDTASLVRRGEALKAIFLSGPPRGRLINREDPIPYLNEVEALMHDAERRVRENRAAFELESIEGLDTERQIRILIEHLDEASARQIMQPGGISLTSDPIAHKLYEIGDSCIDALFDVFDSDDRLTRSVSFGRDFFPSRRIHSVKDAATSIILAVLDYPVFTRQPDGNFLIEDLEAYWKKYRGVSAAERKYGVLSDDGSTHKQWLAAAKSITDWATVDRSTGWIRRIQVKPGEPLPPMKGDPLRDDRIPSVSDLMAQRISQMKGAGEFRGTTHFRALSEAFQMARSLFKWDPAYALPSMIELIDRLKDARVSRSWSEEPGRRQLYNLAFATVVRMRLGDSSAAKDFAGFLEDSPWPANDFSAESLFAPLILFPDDPVLKQLGEQLFGSPESAWHPKHQRTGFSNKSLTSRLLVVTPYRESVLGLLDDTSVVGEVWLGRNSLEYETADGGAGGAGPVKSNLLDGHDVSAGRSELRACDAVAFIFSRLKGAPEFLPLWNEDEKLAEIMKIKEFIRENYHILYTLSPGYRGESIDSWMSSEPIERR